MSTNGGKGGFTKGPWKVGYEYDSHNRPSIQIKREVTYVEGCKPTTYLIGEVTYPTTTGNTVGAEERRANARLVASAPDLYEMLESAPDIMQMQPEEFYVEYTAWVNKARAAIARAEGEGL